MKKMDNGKFEAESSGPVMGTIPIKEIQSKESQTKQCFLETCTSNLSLSHHGHRNSLNYCNFLAINTIVMDCDEEKSNLVLVKCCILMQNCLFHL